MQSNVINKIKSAPKEPGVYIFYSKNPSASSGQKVLYVGKAANLRTRLKSYLRITNLKTQSLHEEATKLEYISLRSEIEALIEESRFIKELRPRYNILWSDDKSYLYVYFSPSTGSGQAKFSKIFVAHERTVKAPSRDRIGPFTDGSALRLVLKLFRRYFPYCTCLRPHLRDCLNAQIGKCLGFCCNRTIDEQTNTKQRTTTYRKNIRALKMILRGNSRKLLKSLSGEEKAALKNIFEHRDFLGGEDIASQKRAGADLDWSIEDGKSARPRRLLPLEQKDAAFEKQFLAALKKVECYDNSNFAGKEAVGAMTALVKKDGAWVPDKNSYRKFKIKWSPTRDDPRMIYEIVSRRLNHPEWPYPDLIIIDGGITQYKAALRAVGSKNIKVISFAKPEQKIIGWQEPPEELKKLVQQAIYQTHNFVIRYHRKVRQKAMFGLQ